MRHLRRLARGPFLPELLVLGVLTACLAGTPAAAELPVEAFPAFATPAGLTGEPRIYTAGERLFAHVGEPANRLYALDPQTLAATSLSATPLLPLVAAGDRLLVKDLAGQGLVAAGEDGLLPLPVMEPNFPAVAGTDGLAFFGDHRPGQQLWQSDGTVAGTRLLVDLDPAYLTPCPPNVPCLFNLPYQIAAGGNLLYFNGRLPGGSPNVFSFDRASGEIHQVSELSGFEILDIEPLPGGGVAYLAVQFGFFPPNTFYLELWVDQGGENRRVFTFFPISDQNLDYLHVLGDKLLIVVRDPPQDQLWVWQSGDAAAKKIAGFRHSGNLTDRTWPVAGGKFYFPATEAIGDVELWATDGTAEGTYRVADVHTGPVGSFPHDFLALPDGRVIFAAEERLLGDELFITDGTSEGTVLLADIAPGDGVSSHPSDLVRHGNRIFAQAQREGEPRQLFYLDLPADPNPGFCPPDRLCLGNGRFEAAVAVGTPDGNFAGRREHSQDDSGVFSFFSAGNWEMLVKVLDGCAINDHFWVFSAAATDVDYTLTVTDRANGAIFVHHHAGGEPAPALTEIEAFETCGLPPPEPQYAPAPPSPENAPVCGDGDALCFGQLTLRVDWETAEGSGSAKASPYGTAESGLFSFFSENNQEMLVKVLDACASSGHRWLLASAATDVEFTLKIRNSFNPNENRDYHHPGGSPAPAIIDLESFGQGCGTP